MSDDADEISLGSSGSSGGDLVISAGRQVKLALLSATLSILHLQFHLKSSD